MSFILTPDMIRQTHYGHAWMELRPAPDDPPGIPDDNYMLEICWMNGDMMERDIYGCVSTSQWNGQDFARYGIDWRVWDQWPGVIRRKEIPWKEEARDAEGAAD